MKHHFMVTDKRHTLVHDEGIWFHLPSIQLIELDDDVILIDHLQQFIWVVEKVILNGKHVSDLVLNAPMYQNRGFSVAGFLSSKDFNKEIKNVMRECS